MLKRDYMHHARAFPGVHEMFERIRAARQKAVVASSGTAGGVEQYKQVARIADLVDDVTPSDKREAIEAFSERLPGCTGQAGSVASAG